MTATEKQIEANRINARKSTGPKTEAGKNKSAQNAVKHGMYSHRAIIDSPAYKEDPEEYAALMESLYEELQPRSAFQESLVHTIADCLWRSQRAVFAETAQIQSRLADVDQSVHTQWLIQRSFPKGHLQSDSLDDPENCRRYRDNLIGESCIPYPKACQNIMRYEASLDRRLHRAYKLLETLQSRPRLSTERPTLSPLRSSLSPLRRQGPISHCEDDTETISDVSRSSVETREAVGDSNVDGSLSVGSRLRGNDGEERGDDKEERRDDKKERRDDKKERRDDGEERRDEEQQNEQTNPIAESQSLADCGRQASSPAPALRETCVPFRQPGTTAGHVVGREKNEQTNPIDQRPDDRRSLDEYRRDNGLSPADPEGAFHDPDDDSEFSGEEYIQPRRK